MKRQKTEVVSKAIETANEFIDYAETQGLQPVLARFLPLLPGDKICVKSKIDEKKYFEGKASKHCAILFIAFY